MSETKQPQGAIALIHWPDGDVLASASDFNRSGYGGYSLFEAQRIRVKDAVKHKAIRAICHDHVAECMESYHVDALINSLIQKKGYSLTVIPVGYEGDDAVQKERQERRRP